MKELAPKVIDILKYQPARYTLERHVVYRYNKDSSYDFAKEMIGSDYAGGIHCDGYEVYHKFEHAKTYGCMASARRYFVEAMEVSPHYKKVKGLNAKALKELKEYSDDNPSYGNIVQTVNSFKELFRMEQNIHIKKANDRRNKKKRQEEQKLKLEGLVHKLLFRIDSGIK